MATAIGMGFDVSALLDSIKNADKALGDLMSKSNQASKSIINAFQQIANQGVGAYVESLEKQMRLYESINATITETSGKAKKGYEEMKVGVDSVVNSLNDMIKILQQTNLYKEYKIKLVSDEELAKIKVYQTELSNLFNSEMQYSQRMQAIKEANANRTQRELEEYKKLSSEIERLQKLQSSATYELNKPTSISTYNAAKDALSEIERQLADHKARMVELERKYEAEILVINQQGSIARFEEIRKAERKDLEANEKYKKDKENNLNSLVSSYEREAEAVKRKAEAEENAQKRIQALAQQAMEAQRSFVERRVNDANKVAQAEHDANQKAFQEALNIQQQALERFARNEHEKREEIKRTREAGLEAAQALDKAQARTESLNRAKNHQRTQKYGDTSSQALAAYDRLVSGKGQLSVNNMQDVLSKLEQAQKKINLKTSEGRERYNELEAAIKKVKSTIDSVVNAEENAAKKRLKLLKDIASEQSKSRSSLYRLTQSSGDTTKQAEAAYNRIYGDKGIQSVKNFSDVLSKLESAQVKINQRTEDGRRKYEEFEKMIQRVKSSIQNLSTTDSEKAEALRNAQAKTNQQTKDNSAKIKSERDAMYKMYEQMFDNIAKKNGQTAEQVIKKNQEELRQRRKYVNEMTAMYERMFDEIARKESQNRASKYGRIQATGDTSNQALAAYNRLYSDKGVKSINNMNTALQRLRDAQSKLNLNTEEGRNKYNKLGEAIKRVEKDMAKLSQQSENVNKKHSQLLNISEQLQRRLALVFSVSQITGYINKIVQVRGEFELQQKALQAIVQNVDEANKLWDKTVALAVKSPFRVKELVTYTKQLAAYRIETSQLYDTTKRLADVSAGLGVDMQRLILAYGQVRAANFLRGTELRQFTEAGIPMLEELAKHFTELEGRAISVGDVFERISKRMVTFQDVSAVFQRMTNEGGVFYDMQAKQSETLKGQISNLHDAIDLMMNDIGNANEEGLKNAVLFARKLVDNWEDVVDAGKMWLTILSPLIARTVLFKTANSGLAMSMLGLFNQTKIGLKTSISYGRWLVDLEKKSRIAAWGVRGLTTALRGIATIGIAAIGVGLISLVTDLYLEMTKASREAARLKKELNGIISEDISIIEKNSNAYRDLYTRLNTLNKGTQARKDIINKLNSQYGEYLSFVVDEETSVEKLANAYDDVVKKMKEKQSLATFEKGMSAISESYGNALSEAKDEFYDLFKGASIKSNKNDFSFIIPTKKEIDDIYTIIQQRSREMNAEQLDDLNKQSDLIQQIVKNYYGEEFYLSRDFNVSIELLNILVRKKKQELELQKEINLQYKTVLKSRDANLALEKLQLKYAEKRREVEKNAINEFDKQKKLTELATQEKLDIIDVKVEFGEIDKESAERAKHNIINWATELNKSINNTIKIELGKDFSEEELSKVLITESMQKNQSSADYVKNIKSSWETQNQIIKEQISLKSEGVKIDENILTSALKAEKLYRKTAEILGIELDYVEKLDDETRNAINSLLPEEYQISLEQAYGGIDKIISDLKKEEAKHLNIIEQINERKKEGLPINDQELKDAEDAYWWTKKRLDLIDPKTKTPISEGKVNTINAKLEEKYKIDAVDRTKDEVTLLSEANSEKEKAIAYEEQLNAQKKQGHNITKEELDAAKKDVEQYTLLWKLLGGTEKETTGGDSSNSLYDERIKVIDDLNKKYKELNKTLDKSTSLQGAFEAYIDAFADAYEGISWIPKNVREMSPEEFSEKVLNFPNEDALVSFLDKLANEPMKAFEKIKVELAKGKYVYDAKVRVQVEEDKKLIDSIEDMFGNYEISLELEKLNIPPDLAKRLFGVDAINLGDIRNKIETDLSSARASGGKEDLVKDLEQQLKKVEDLEQKALKERLKRYSQFLVKGQSERVRIKIEELRELSKLDEDYQKKRIDEEDYKLAKRGIQKENQGKLDSLAWKEFQNTDLYIQMFEDLDYVSSSTLNNMKEKLVEMRDSLKELDPSDLKAINDQIEKIDEQSTKNNPIKALTSNLKEYIDYLKERKELEKNLLAQQEVEDKVRSQVEKAELDVSKKQAEYEKVSKDPKASTKQVADSWTLLQNAKLHLEVVLNRLVAEEKITKEIADQIRNGQNAKKATSESLQDIGSQITEAANTLPQVAENLESVFGAMDAGTRDTIESIAEIGAGVGSAIQGFASGNYVQGVLGVTQAISGIFKVGDKKKEREIQSQIELVDKLGKQYEKLEKAIDKAYELDTLESYYDQAQANLDQQIAAYNNMIEAERDKKDSDSGRIAEWERAQEELEQAKEDLKKSTVEDLGGNYDYKSATREFVDAWLEAFNETGNGMDGLKKHFKSFWKEIVLNQVVQGGATKIMKPLMDAVNTALENDFKINDSEEQMIDSMSETVMKNLDEYMKVIQEKYGNLLSETDTELSGLQRGIQGITEDQADVLASYLNSIRMFVSSNNQLLAQLVNLQGGVASASVAENPMLPQLRIVAQQTTAIRTLLDSVVKTGGHSNGGAGIKVFMS